MTHAKQIHYDPADLAALASIEERHFWFRARRRIILDALARWFAHSHDYLEIGCGTGFNARAVTASFPHWRVIASDPLSPEPSIAPAIDALQIPYSGEFDVVGAYDVLEHIEDDGAALAQLRKACRRGGGILLTVPQHPWLWSPSDLHAQHLRRYRARSLRALIVGAGFEILQSTSFLTTSLPLFTLRAAALRFSGHKPRAAAPSEPLNWLLERSMDFDRLLIRVRLPLPFGASLLVAARCR